MVASRHKMTRVHVETNVAGVGPVTERGTGKQGGTRMGRRFTTALMVVGTLLGILTATAGSVAADTNYTCPGSTCSFTVPDFYSKVSSDDSSIIFKDANSGGTFTVALVDFPASGTLDDAVQIISGQFSSSLQGYQPDPAGPQNETLSGNPARSLVYAYTANDGSDAKAKAFFSVYQGKLYLLQFATTADQEDAFVQNAKPVFDSWQFT